MDDLRYRRQGQREVEGCAGAEFAFGPDAAAVGQDDVLDDGQAEAGAAGLAGACFVDAVEALEDAIEVLGGDAGAEVLDGEFDFGGNIGLKQPRADANPAAGFAVLEGVLNEVAEDLVHGVGIGQDQRIGRAGRFEFDPGVDDDSAQGLDGVLDQGAGPRGLQRELVVRALDAGQGQQILNKAVHAGGVLEDDAEELAGGFGAGIRVLDQRLDVALDGGERGAQLVADVGDKVAAGFFSGLDAGDVVEHDQRAARGQGGCVDLKDAAGDQRAGPAKADFPVLKGAVDAGQDLGIAHEVDQRAAGMDLGSGDALHGGVGPADQPLGSDGDH